MATKVKAPFRIQIDSFTVLQDPKLIGIARVFALAGGLGYKLSHMFGIKREVKDANYN